MNLKRSVRQQVHLAEQSTFNILVLCTGNSARSIMAEALFNHLGSGTFHAVSAGSRPTGRVNPLALERIHQLGAPSDAYRSKHWREFLHNGEFHLDIVLTVCDNAAGDVCPFLAAPYQHVHWSLPDPAAVSGDIAARRAAFAACFEELERRIRSITQQVNSSTDILRLVETMAALELPGNPQ